MNSDHIVKKSDQVVSRVIEGETIIIPLSAGIGDLDEELYSLNKMGQEIWEKVDGQKTLDTIIDELKQEYSASGESIRQDVSGFIDELARRKIVILQPKSDA